MFKDFGISEAEWNATPQSARGAFVALQDQLRLSEIRFTAYEQKLAALEDVRVPVTEAKRLKDLERENQQLKRLVADQALDILMLKEVSRGKF